MLILTRFARRASQHLLLRSFIHSGDMRFTEALTAHPALLAARDGGVEALYLDTTYCNPRRVDARPECAKHGKKRE
jgi:hypothetical protein